MSRRVLPFVVLTTLLGLTMELPALAQERCYARFLLSILQELDHPMTFQKVWALLHSQDNPRGQGEMAILAEGGLVPGTTDSFRRFLEKNPLPPGTAVYLSSSGGIVDEGLALGSLIRERRFDTVIGTFNRTGIDDLSKGQYLAGSRLASSPDASICLSACTFTFLGGVERRIYSKDLYGVHRIYIDKPIDPAEAQARIQQSIARILSFVRSMGVDPGLIEDMVQEGKTTVLSLSKERLVALRVVTSPIIPSSVGPAPTCNLSREVEESITKAFEAIEREKFKPKP